MGESGSDFKVFSVECWIVPLCTGDISPKIIVSVVEQTASEKFHQQMWNG